MLVKLRIALGVALILCALVIASLYAMVGQNRSSETGRRGEALISSPQAPARGDTIVVARLPIARGQRITADGLTLMRIEGPLIGTPLRDVTAATGGIARSGIAAGQIIMATDVISAGETAGSLALLVPPGRRAVALSVNDEVAVGSFISPPDRVDIQLVFSAGQVARLALATPGDAALEARVLLQNVEVLSAGETLRVATDGKAIRMHTITVAVTPRQAQLLAVAKETGAFYLALRNPRDDAVTALPPVSARPLGGDAPPRALTARTVEVLAGTTSSRMTVTGDQ
jgi:pilus assembly protein CpaB